eukprot:359041-Chlamydomonas_euryale.AAC.2
MSNDAFQPTSQNFSRSARPCCHSVQLCTDQSDAGVRTGGVTGGHRGPEDALAPGKRSEAIMMI